MKCLARELHQPAVLELMCLSDQRPWRRACVCPDEPLSTRDKISRFGDIIEANDAKIFRNIQPKASSSL